MHVHCLLLLAALLPGPSSAAALLRARQYETLSASIPPGFLSSPPSASSVSSPAEPSPSDRATRVTFVPPITTAPPSSPPPTGVEGTPTPITTEGPVFGTPSTTPSEPGTTDTDTDTGLAGTTSGGGGTSAGGGATSGPAQPSPSGSGGLPAGTTTTAAPSTSTSSSSASSSFPSSSLSSSSLGFSSSASLPPSGTLPSPTSETSLNTSMSSGPVSNNTATALSPAETPELITFGPNPEGSPTTVTLVPTGAQVVASLSPSLSAVLSGSSTVSVATVSVTAGSATVTVLPALSISTGAGGEEVTVTQAEITVASGGAVVTTQSAASASSTSPAAPPQNSTIPASAPSVTYPSGTWQTETNPVSSNSSSPDSSPPSSTGESTDQQSTPLGPSLNNGNVPPSLMCPAMVVAEQTRSSYEVGATVAYQFSGTGIFFQLVPRNTTGIYTAWVDSPSNAISIDGYQQFSTQQELSTTGSADPSCQIGFGVQGLPDGDHTIWVRLDGKSPLAGQETTGQEAAPGLTVAGFTQTGPNTTAAAASGAVAGVKFPGCSGWVLWTLSLAIAAATLL